MKVLPSEEESLSFITTGKPKKRLKTLFIGSPIANVKLSDFALHGLPVPLYTHSPNLVLLFRNHADCGNYLKSLYAIKEELQAFDQPGLKPAIQESIVFVCRVIESLI